MLGGSLFSRKHAPGRPGERARRVSVNFFFKILDVLVKKER